MRLRTICICAVTLLAAGLAAAQKNSKADLHPNAQRIRVRVLVQEKRNHHPVEGLAKSDFLVTQDDAPQKLTYFGHGSSAKRPLGIVLLLDTAVMNPLRIEALTHSLPTALDKLSTADPVALWTMDSAHTREIQAPTTDRDLLIDDLLNLDTKAAKSPQFDPGPIPALQAVLAARRQFHGNVEMTVVLVTNDLDAQPDEKTDALRHTMLQDGISLHLLYRAGTTDRLLHGLSSVPVPGGHSLSVPGVHEQPLIDLARESGGELVDAARDDYNGALLRVLGDIAASYVLEYARPAGPAADAPHLISVALSRGAVKHRDAVVLVYRKAYYDSVK